MAAFPACLSSSERLNRKQKLSRGLRRESHLLSSGLFLRLFKTQKPREGGGGSSAKGANFSRPPFLIGSEGIAVALYLRQLPPSPPASPASGDAWKGLA